MNADWCIKKNGWQKDAKNGARSIAVAIFLLCGNAFKNPLLKSSGFAYLIPENSIFKHSHKVERATIMVIIDAKDAVLGRLCTHVAKSLIRGEDVVVLNAEKVIVTGAKKFTTETYLAKREIGGFNKGPYFPRSPDGIVRRTIRGMMPYKTKKGRDAMKKLYVAIGVPAKYAGKETVKAGQKDIKSRFVYIGNIATSIGWRK